MSQGEYPLLPTVMNGVLSGVAGFVTGLAVTVPLWLFVPWALPGTVPTWVYPTACAVMVVVVVVLIASKLSGAARWVAMVFPVGLALACATPTLVVAAVHAW